MKKWKRIPIFLLLLAGTVVSYSQTIEEKVLDFHVAPMLSRLSSSSDYIDANGMNLGLKLGASVNFKLKDWVGIVGGLDFAIWSGGQLLYRKGGNFLPRSSLSDPNLNKGDKPMPDNTSIRYTLNYIEMPVGLQLEIPIPGGNRVYARIPMITLGVRNRARGTIEAGSVMLKKEKIGKDVSIFNFMWGMGLGLDFERWNKDLSAMIFVNSGLADVTRDKGTQVITVDGQEKVIRENSKGALSQYGIQMAVKIR